MKVVDTNVIAYLPIEGKDTEKAKSLLRKDSDWMAPILWKSEIRNILSTYVRDGYFDLSQALFLMKKAEDLMRNGGYHVRSIDVLELAKESGCSAYDCEFVALAKDLGVKLVTSDQQLLKCFPTITESLTDY